jgi:hypothetical protein
MTLGHAARVLHVAKLTRARAARVFQRPDV